jgi:hypothetical protein
MSKSVKKLGSDRSYKRPQTTYQEQLIADEIAEKLQGYEKVDDISEVPLNTHIRYFKIEKDGTHTFRTGGFLFNKTNADKYVYLSNGKNSWAVQIISAIFYRKISHTEEIDALHRHYKKKLQDKDMIINKLKKYIKIKIGSFDESLISTNTETNSASKTETKKVSKTVSKSSGKKISNKKKSSTAGKKTNDIPKKTTNKKKNKTSEKKKSKKSKKSNK